MNGIDGGLWNYGDASYPQAEKTFFAGTFNKNHMGMTAARAVLQTSQARRFRASAAIEPAHLPVGSNPERLL
jgi:hypothetical protein